MNQKKAYAILKHTERFLQCHCVNGEFKLNKWDSDFLLKQLRAAGKAVYEVTYDEYVKDHTITIEDDNPLDEDDDCKVEIEPDFPLKKKPTRKTLCGKLR